MIAESLNSYALHLKFLRRLVADVAANQMACQPANVPNHAAWTIGHLAYSCQQLGGELGLAPWLPADWGARFGTGSKPVADADEYPDKKTLLRALADGQDRLTKALRATDELALRVPLPDVRYRDRFSTVGHAVTHILSGHTALHLGQLTIWRRAMGLVVEPESLDDDSTHGSRAGSAP